MRFRKEKVRDMEMTPNKWCVWQVSMAFLEEALNTIQEKGGEQISVASYLRGGTTDFIIAYYNPPRIPPQSMDGSPDAATIQ